MSDYSIVFSIADMLIGFATVFWAFMTMPLGTAVLEITWLKQIPFVTDYVIKAMSFIMPYTPLQIMSGGGLIVIVMLVILKKVVPLL